MSEEWKPIESAPRDGTPILVCVTYSRQEGGWHTEQWVDWTGGTYVWPMFQQRVDILFPPTHWMPLPKPPVESEAAA